MKGHHTPNIGQGKISVKNRPDPPDRRGLTRRSVRDQGAIGQFPGHCSEFVCQTL